MTTGAIPPAIETTPHTLRGLWALRLFFATVGRVTPGFAADIGERLFTTPPRWNAPERETEILSTGEQFRVSYRSIALQCWRWGSGPPVLLVHGWGGRGGQMTPFVAPLVDAGFSPVTFDGPAHGASQGTRTSLPDFAHALTAVWRHVVPHPVAVVGHSMGAAASVLALRDQIQPDVLVLLAPPARPVDYLVRFGEILAMPAKTLRVLARRVEERYGIEWDDLDFPQLARRFSHPMLLVHDTEDRDALWSHGKELADAWPASEMITTSGLGHRRILRDQEVGRQVASWISRNIGRDTE